MRRHVLGLIALASFAFAALLHWCPPLESYRAAGDAGLRVGLVLGAIWLAWPDLHRLPGWFWWVLPLAIVALIYARGMLVYLAPLFAVALAAYVLYRRVWRARP